MQDRAWGCSAEALARCENARHAGADASSSRQSHSLHAPQLVPLPLALLRRNGKAGLLALASTVTIAAASAMTTLTVPRLRSCAKGAWEPGCLAIVVGESAGGSLWQGDVLCAADNVGAPRLASLDGH
jgi:hypothetical protein